jgi:hypothetical protein
MSTSGSTLFIEAFGGMAGDMFLAALLDLEHPLFSLEDLRALLPSLVPGEASLEVERAWRGSLSGCLLHVRVPQADQPHRGLSECLALIESAALSPRAQERAAAIFDCIARAEAAVHGCSVEEVHFHEVGAVDALIDVCGAALALDRLGIERIYALPPFAGGGRVQCAHGEMPVPAPGTAQIMRGLPMQLAREGGERLTPTGAAILATCADVFEAPGLFSSAHIGYGAGHRDPDSGPPNLVRVQLGGQVGGLQADRTAWMMEVTLDDMSGEELGFLIEGLRGCNALEVWSSQVQMKKDRPGVIVSALCRERHRAEIQEFAFAHSTTMGVRWMRYERAEYSRETLEIELDGHPVRVVLRSAPVSDAPVGPLDLSPEFDDLAALARISGRPIRDLERRAIAEARRQIGG